MDSIYSDQALYMARSKDFSRPICASPGVTSIPMSAPQTIAELISSLPEEERVILTLHYLRGKSAGEIAALLSVPERAVLVVIESGKRHISAYLGL